MYDVAIIGAGIMGCAAAKELSKYEASIAVLEKGADVACGTTKAKAPSCTRAMTRNRAHWRL